MTSAGLIAARSCAVAGTVLTGIPLAAPIALALGSAIAARGLRLDYLMPGELFVLAAPGGILLIVATVVARRFRFVAAALTAVMIAMFCATAWIAGAVGLASGRTPATGWPLALVIGAYSGYVLAMVALCVWGIFICRELFRSRFATRRTGTPATAGREQSTEIDRRAS